jgi:hypothetical protein
MPLPLRTLRVFPNPWEHWTLENGPQGALAFAGSRNVGPLRYVGAMPRVNVREERDIDDPRGNDAKYVFSYPGLNPELTDGTAIELPAGDPFWHDRLHDGSLIPADARTLKAFPDSRFKSLTEARAACIADFESHYGTGSFAAAFEGKPFAPAPAANQPAPTDAEKAVLDKAAADKAAAEKASAGAAALLALPAAPVPEDAPAKGKGGKS